MWISDVSVRRPVFAVMLCGALVALGWISLGRVGVDFFPRVEYPLVTVTTILEGATPGTIETEVTEVLEEEISNLASLDDLSSTSSEGLSVVIARFALEMNPETAVQKVRAKIELARRNLPPDTEPPVVEMVDPDSQPIMSVMIAGDLPIRDLTDFAKDGVKERLQRIPGVGSVTLVGAREREVRIWLDTYRLRAYEITAVDVIQAIRREHAEIPGGRLETASRTAEFSFKTKGEVQSVDEFADIVVAFHDGAPTLLGDVARVEDGLEDERTYAELGGVPGVSLELRRQSGENTVAVADRVKRELARIAEKAPAGVRILVARDASVFIASSVRETFFDMILGGILAVLVTLAFLRNVRTTLLVATAIPTSIVATFYLFYLAGFTLNIISLIGISISIGLLIDDAIVVVEAIHRRIEAGEPPLQAAATGTAEVGPAVFAATAAIVAVFIPIAFMHGMIGRFFYEYGLTVVFAVSVSLLVAVTLTPALGARVMRRQDVHGRLFVRFEKVYLSLESGYERLLALSLNHGAVILGLAALSLVGAGLIARSIPMEFSPRSDRSGFEVHIELPLGTGIEATKHSAKRAQLALASIDGVTDVFATIGAGSQGRVNEILIYTVLKPKQERSQGMLDLMEDARGVLPGALPEAKEIIVSEVSQISGGGITGFGMQYALEGSDLGELAQLSETLTARMRASPLYSDVTSSYETGRPEIQTLVDRRAAADQGVSLLAVANTLRATVGGVDASTYEEHGDRYDVRVRLEADQRDEVSKLGLLQVRAADGGLANLSSIARFEVGSGPVQIDRENRTRKIELFANNPPEVALGTAVAELDRFVSEAEFPVGVVGRHRGWSEKMQDSAEAVVFAFFVAVLALYMVLGSQFNSFVQPLVTMTTAPLAFFGAFAALALSGLSLSIFSQIALLALMGLVMKNGILLVDYANQARARGLDARQAMLEAGPIRLRPVLMT
ncbi:MAG: efflux RND transporter permease subunit, partial [Myxococcales bacterium]|nr:efflux RND transporter permease subunit [Myxococcales bacterium]